MRRRRVGPPLCGLWRPPRFNHVLVAEQPDMTLDEIVAAMRKRKIAGGRSAVWRFFDRRNISFKKLRTRRSRSVRMSCAHDGAGCVSKACLSRRGWCSSTKPKRTPRWCNCAGALRAASD